MFRGVRDGIAFGLRDVRMIRLLSSLDYSIICLKGLIVSGRWDIGAKSLAIQPGYCQLIMVSICS